MNSRTLRILGFAAAAIAIASLAFYVTPPASAAKPRIIRDNCNQTSGDGMGHECPGENYLLIRPSYAPGTCADWMCCPANADGQTYDCSNAVNPTRVTPVPDRLKDLLGPNAATLDPGPAPAKKPPVAPKLDEVNKAQR